MCRKTYLILLLLAALLRALPLGAAEEGILKGKIVDAKTGEPLVGAFVALEDHSRGAAAGLDGEFSVQITARLPINIEASMIGYQTRIISVTSFDEPLLIALTEDGELLDEVIVLGYAKTTKNAMTSAVNTIQSESLENIQSSDINGKIQGAKGSNGAPGATFRPSVDASGNISWTNDGGLDNPASQNIRGPAGRDGEQGPAGASAFEAAVDAGYQGTEATFNAALAALPYHGARHLPGGADPISIRTESLENGAVTAEKLAPGAVSIAYAADLNPALWEGTTAPFTQTSTIPGLLGSDTPLVDLLLSGTLSTDRKRLEDYAQLYRAATADGALTVYALARPTVTLPLRILCIRK